MADSQEIVLKLRVENAEYRTAMKNAQAALNELAGKKVDSKKIDIDIAQYRAKIDQAKKAGADFRADLEKLNKLKLQRMELGVDTAKLQNARAAAITAMKEIELAAKKAGRSSEGLGDSLGDMAAKAASTAAGFALAQLGIGSLSEAIGKVKQVVSSALEEIEKFKMGTISTASILTSLGEAPSMESFQRNLKYAQGAMQELDIVAAKYIASGEEVRTVYQGMIQQGVVPVTQKDFDNLGQITDAVKTITQGQNFQIQGLQEIRSLMEGVARPGSMLARLIEGQVGNLQAWVDKHRKIGDLIPALAQKLQGFKYAQSEVSELSETWKSTLQTIFGIVSRQAFAGVYKDMTSSLKRISELFLDQKGQLTELSQDIIANIRQDWESIKGDLEDIGKWVSEHKKDFGNIASITAEALGNLRNIIKIVSVPVKWVIEVSLGRLSLAYEGKKKIEQFVSGLTAGSFERDKSSVFGAEGLAKFDALSGIYGSRTATDQQNIESILKAFRKPAPKNPAPKPDGVNPPVGENSGSGKGKGKSPEQQAADWKAFYDGLVADKLKAQGKIYEAGVMDLEKERQAELISLEGKKLSSDQYAAARLAIEQKFNAERAKLEADHQAAKNELEQGALKRKAELAGDWRKVLEIEAAQELTQEKQRINSSLLSQTEKAAAIKDATLLNQQELTRELNAEQQKRNIDDRNNLAAAHQAYQDHNAQILNRRLEWYDWEIKLGRQTLAAEIADLQQSLAATDLTTEAKIANRAKLAELEEAQIGKSMGLDREKTTAELDHIQLVLQTEIDAFNQRTILNDMEQARLFALQEQLAQVKAKIAEQKKAELADFQATFKDFLTNTMKADQNFSVTFKSLWVSLKNAFIEQVAQMIIQTQAFQAALIALRAVMTALNIFSFLNPASAIANVARQSASQVYSGNPITSAWASWTQHHAGGPVRRFHSGGPSLASDEVPAILQAGEYVLSRQMVAAIKGQSASGASSGAGSGGHVFNINITGTFDTEDRVKGMLFDFKRELTYTLGRATA